MELRVLGRHGLYPPRAGACSSFFVGFGGGNVLLDCGPGALSHMEPWMLASLEAVVLTHLHWDHVSDALPLRYALERLGRKITVFLPEEPPEICRLLTASEAIEPIFLRDGMQLSRNGCELSFVAMRHPVPAYGVRLCADGATLAYSGDTNTCEGLAKLLSCEPDIALVDACFSDTQWDEQKPHLSARLAAGAMAAARVKQPLLTHLAPGTDSHSLLLQAQEACPECAWAEEGGVYRPHA